MKRRRLLKWGLGIGVPLNAIIFTPLADFSILADRYLFAPVISIGYIGLLSYLLDKFSQSLMINALEKIGKVALSCYILQNILASIIFYGWGFGLGFHSNAWIIIAVWIFITLILILFSYVWLKYFRKGPFEFIWRASANFRIKQ